MTITANRCTVAVTVNGKVQGGIRLTGTGDHRLETAIEHHQINFGRCIEVNGIGTALLCTITHLEAQTAVVATIDAGIGGKNQVGNITGTDDLVDGDSAAVQRQAPSGGQGCQSNGSQTIP